MSSDHSYGKGLPDQVDRIADFFASHLALVNDVRELYKEQAALEREYAGKLQALAKKSLEKKNKIKTTVSVGADPTKVWDDPSSRQSTLVQAYGEIIGAVNNAAQDHIDIADALNSQVVDALKILERKNENLAKKEMQFFHKLLSNRDEVFSERLKTKQKYDEECREVETHRQKQASAHDDRHADRAAKQYDQQRNEMLNCKNLYVIATNKANKIKARFYDEDLPDLEDRFQTLQTHLVKKFIKTVLHSQALQSNHYDTLKGRLATAGTALTNVNTISDQDLFIDHNIRTFVAPNDWLFEPCAVHYDTNELNVEAMPKVFLQNKLGRCRSQLEELTPLIDAKRREFAKLSAIIDAYSTDRNLGDTDDIYESYFDIRQQLSFLGTSVCILDAEVKTIVDALGGDEGSQRPHSFKRSSFSIPTHCGYCKSSIWGLSKQGKTCQLCGLSVHSRCELKVPADCVASKDRSNSAPDSSNIGGSHLSRQSTSEIPRRSSLAQSTHTEESFPLARVLFDFSATSEFELNVSEGMLVRVHEEEDGSGWVKVADDRSGKGLVPASYIELMQSEDSQTPSKVQQRGQYVRGIYEYHAQGSDELSVSPGELIVLSGEPNDSQNLGGSWWKGTNSSGQTGIFPSNYVELA